MLSFIQNLTTAEWLSSLAILVSVVSAMVAFKIKKAETHRAAAQSILTLVSRLISANAENSKLWTTPMEQRSPAFNAQTSASLQEIMSLSRQAVQIIELYPDLPSDVDCVVLAQSFTTAQDWPNAERFWDQAVAKSPSDFDRIQNARGYANFLFGQGDFEAGRAKYRKALEYFKSDTDFHKYTNGYTYRMWYVSEMSHSRFENAKGLYDEAKRLFDSIGNANIKDGALQDLNQMKSIFESALGAQTGGMSPDRT